MRYRQQCNSMPDNKSFKPIKFKLCKKEFIPSTTINKYDNCTHYNKCLICGKEFEIKEGSLNINPR